MKCQLIKRTMNFIDYKIELAKAKNFRELQLALKRCLNKHDISYYAFTYYNRHPNSLNKIRYEHASHDYQLWHQYYLAEGFHEVDPTMYEIIKSVIPVYWSVEQQIIDAKSEKELTMRKVAHKYGLDCGYCIPVRGHAEDFAILVIARSKSQAHFKKLSSIESELLPIAYYYYHYARIVLIRLQGESNCYFFTKRQMQCLNLLAKEANINEISKILNITERTVNDHIQKINKKLGVKNKYLAVAKAIEKHIIDI